MGYTTNFEGAFQIKGNVSQDKVDYINKLNETRRMQRDVTKLFETFKGEHGHPTPTGDTPEEIYGSEGEFFVGGTGFMGQTNDKTIINYNRKPSTQPGLWCQWRIEDNKLVWDEGEKFYYYVEWLSYLIKNFFERWGWLLTGRIAWQGEEMGDMGVIFLKDNEMIVHSIDITKGFENPQTFDEVKALQQG
jgi:hypothetical protein